MSTDTMIDQEEVVSVPVPRRHLAAVFRTLADAMTSGPTPASGASPVGILPANPFVHLDREHQRIDWNEANCRKLRSRYVNVAGLALIDATAEKPGQRVYIEDVTAGHAFSREQVRAGLSSLTKQIMALFGVGRNDANWPAPFNWDAAKQVAYYVMEPDIATAWKASAKSLAGR